MDRDVRNAAEILLGRKLDALRDALDAAGASESDSAARSVLWSKCQAALRAHSRRALSDYVALLSLFDSLAYGDGIEEPFEALADRMGELLSERLATGARADRNRANNLIATVKAEAGETLREEAVRWERARSASATSRESSGAEDLDDRLPLARRKAFDRALDERTEDARRENRPFALVMMDIDHFKRINDSFGHPVGDEVLVEVAVLVVERLAHKGRAYRYGGEEISLLMPTYSAEEAIGLAERIRKDLEAKLLSSHELRVTASFGVASFPDRASDATSLLERADAALYEAKRGGRNRVSVAPPITT